MDKPKLAATADLYRTLCQMAENEVDGFRAEMEKLGYVRYPDPGAVEIPADLGEIQKAAAVNVVSVVLNLIGVTHLE